MKDYLTILDNLVQKYYNDPIGIIYLIGGLFVIFVIFMYAILK